MSGAPVVKICGITAERELQAVVDGGGSHVGLWWGVGQTDRDLTGKQLAALAEQARQLGLIPVLVTLRSEPEAIVGVALAAGIQWIQLHAFQHPRVVAEVRRRLGRQVVLIKVIHVTPDGTSVDARLAGAYQRAGADLFLIDSMVNGTVGSTGSALPANVVREVSGRLPADFIVAGGLGSAPSQQQLEFQDLDGWIGIDVDSAARGSTSRITQEAVAAIVRAWTDRPFAARPPVPTSDSQTASVSEITA